MTDPLEVDIPLQDVETSIALLPEGDYDLQVVESAVVPNKDNTGRNWKLKLTTINPATAVDGRNVNPNFPLFHTMALQAKDGSSDPEAFKRGLSESIDAMFGTTKADRPALTGRLIGEAVGKIVKAHVVIDEYQGNKNNKIKRLKKQG